MKSDDKTTILKDIFGYDTFRTGQEVLIDALIGGRDALGIMPTGAGKSLCYQVPALALPGMALIISPLISLMKDQVDTLKQAGVAAACLNSSLDEGEYQDTIADIREGRCKLLYVTPERLESPEFCAFIQSFPISMVTVDEAHCVSQWGQDFRPSYLAIAPFVEDLPKRPVVGAFTATATEQVRQDILAMLRLDHPKVLVTGFDRPNLFFDVRHPQKKMDAVVELVQERAGKNGIVYCSTRKNVEQVRDALKENGIGAVAYHAGLADDTRRRAQEDFIYDRAPVIVATNAFGMGIDKSNVAFVIHYNMPGDLESYYQEAGRAGRDGEPADCILLYSPQDVRTQQFLIDRAYTQNTDGDAEDLRDKDRARLKAMTFYCHTDDCLRHAMLAYFGEDAPKACGRCGNCNGEKETVDVTLAAQKILSCMVRTGDRFGATILVDTLRGSKSKRVQDLGFDRLSTYGIMADTSVRRIRQIMNWLTNRGYIAQEDGPYPVLHLTAKSRQVLFDHESLTAELPVERAPRPQHEKRTAKPKADGPYDEALYEVLRSLRADLAQKQQVPAYVVFSNAALVDMCRKKPTTPEAFLAVSGVGKAKLERYGDAFLSAIRQEIN